MSKETQAVSTGFPIASILTIIFVLAKLAGKVSWSWWVVFSPLLISVGIGLILLAIALLIVVIIAIVE